MNTSNQIKKAPFFGIIFLFFLTNNNVLAQQIILKQQGFTASNSQYIGNDNYTYQPNSNSGNLATVDSPGALTSRCLKIENSSANNVTQTVTFIPHVLDFGTYNTIQVQVFYSSPLFFEGVNCSPELNDNLRLDFSYDEGATWSTPINLVNGQNGNLDTFDFGLPNTNPTANANPFLFNIPSTSSRVSVRLTGSFFANDGTRDVFLIDDVRIVGIIKDEQTITSGTGNFTVPANVTSLTAQIWGGGGGGANSSTAAGGGGGGGFSTRTYTVAGGAVIPYVIGNGGIAGSNGLNSTFNAATNLITANGGSTGLNRIGGAGGASSGGMANRNGGSGGDARPVAPLLNDEAGGAGGGSAFPSANGSVGTTASSATFTLGGIGFGNGGNGAAGTNNPTAYSGTIGGGGGGRGESVASSAPGGNGLLYLTWSSPEINIKSGNPQISIIDNDNSPSTIDNTDFGAQNFNLGFIDKTFTVYNYGDRTLILSNPITTGTGFSVFSNPGTLNVPAGGTTTFVIRFDPTGAGVINGTVSLTNNDSNENPYNFNILGTGFNPAPEIDLQGGFPLISLVSGDNTPTVAKGSAFGTQNIAYGNVVRTFYVYNLGTSNLTITSITSSNPLIFAVSTISATPILPNTFSTFTVTFIPTAGTLNPNPTITINNNDSNEGTYILRVSGTGNTTAAPDFNIRGGSPLTAININDPASIAKGTDFGDQYIFSGTKTSTFTINNAIGANSLSIGAITFTGGNANTDFTVTTAPATPILANSSTTFTVSYNPTASGSRNTVMSIVNNDPNESPYYFYLSGNGNAYTDSDRDGVTDNIDIDDDNDGILDTLEQSECKLSTTSGTVDRVFLLEDFGAGTNAVAINNTNPGAKTDYAFVNVPSVSPTDGKYTVYYKIGGLVSDTNKISSWGSYAWTDIGDNGDHTTGDVNGRMAVFNADYVPDGVFYELAVDGITPNIPITFDLWVMNIDRSNQAFINNGSSGEQPRLLPNLKLEIVDLLGTVLYAKATDPIARCLDGTINGCGDVVSQWTLKSFSNIDLGLVTSFTIRISNIGPGGFGNDLAIDDLKLTQRYCDYDGNNDPDVIDLDADNDGIPDIAEAGLSSFSFSGASSATTKSQMIRPDAKWTDINPVNGMNDAVDVLIANNTYLTTYVKDSDGDGIRDYLDFDSDNDSIFDIDENTVDNFTTANNGDGDIDGDGKGDGLETDKDGIQDLNDDLMGYGTTAKLLPVDSDGDGIPNYIDVQSFGITGGFDIGNTTYGQLGLYKNLDSNSDGRIDGTTDSDRDGINDALDTSAAGFGSPRNITNQKLLIDFDGRNDYAEGPNLLNNLTKATLMGWIKLDAGFTNAGRIMGQDKFNIAVNAARQLVVTAKGVSLTYSTTALSVSRWYHVAAVYDGSLGTGNLKIYLNGKNEIATANTVNGPLGIATDLKFTIAKNSASSSNYFRGFIDEVRVFDNALSDDVLQKMVYQEVDASGTAIKGSVIPKDIEASAWVDLIAYYRMDNYKNDVIDDFKIPLIDDGLANINFCRIYNVKSLRTQTAPMPFVTTKIGAIDFAVNNPINFINGNDVVDANIRPIVKISHDVTSAVNRTDLGLIVDAGKKYTINGDAGLTNNWYLDLNGKIDLEGKAQLIQTITSDLALSTTGSIDRDQQGTKNGHNYNYWSSPVSTINNSVVNNGFTVGGILNDGINPVNFINYDSDGQPTSPVTLSENWIYRFQNQNNDYANWEFMGSGGVFSVAQGFTMKGSNTLLDSQNYTFIGKPNNAANGSFITTPIAPSNLNLCGNPFPSSLNAVEFIKDNIPTGGNVGSSGAINGTLYFWQHSPSNNSHNSANYVGGYAARNLSGSLASTQPTGISGTIFEAVRPKINIPVGQGFFVTGVATAGVRNITFKNSQREFIKEDNINSNILYKTSASQSTNVNDNFDEPDLFKRVRLGYDNIANFHRQILLAFMENNADNDWNYGYDARLFDSNPSEMCFIAGENNLIINGVGFFDETAIYPLLVKTEGNGIVKFTLDYTQNFEGAQQFYIHDNNTGLYHNIKIESFEINLEEGTYTDRFSLRFNDGTLNTNQLTLENSIFVTYSNDNNHIHVYNNSKDSLVEAVTLFNIIGQQINSWDTVNYVQNNMQIPVSQLSIGTYIVKIKTTNGIVSKKIIIK